MTNTTTATYEYDTFVKLTVAYKGGGNQTYLIDANQVVALGNRIDELKNGSGENVATLPTYNYLAEGGGFVVDKNNPNIRTTFVLSEVNSFTYEPAASLV